MDGVKSKEDANLHVFSNDNWIDNGSLYGIENKRRGDVG